MFESFLKLFEKGPISVVGFADDAALVAKGISASVIRDIMNKAKVHFRLGVQKFTFVTECLVLKAIESFGEHKAQGAGQGKT